MLLYSKATDNSDIPKDRKIQRVDTYVSKIIIKPHQEFDKVCQSGNCFCLIIFIDVKNCYWKLDIKLHNISSNL